MEPHIYWNEIGSRKNFEDPLYLEKMAPYISSNSKIVEYGCGYGRILDMLQKQNFTDLQGFDFSKNMIERGRSTNPKLKLNHIVESGSIPLENQSIDCVILSTVLCCITERQEQEKVINEIFRILKPKGVLYLTDFLLNQDEKYQARYTHGMNTQLDYGVYTTTEGVAVRHHTTTWVLNLLKNFDIQWFEQFDFKTMNNNKARTFHCIAQVPSHIP